MLLMIIDASLLNMQYSWQAADIECKVLASFRSSNDYFLKLAAKTDSLDLEYTVGVSQIYTDLNCDEL